MDKEIYLPSVYDAMKNGGVFHKVAGKDKESVLKNIVEIMPLPKEIDKKFFFQVLYSRELLGSTGIGDGIAIPHVRNPIVIHIQNPFITLSYLENSIDFNAIDGKPVNILFTIVSSTIKVHLYLISRLTFALKTPDFFKAIKNQASRDEILSLAKEIDELILAKSKG